MLARNSALARRGGFGGDAGGQQLAVGLGQFILQTLGAQGGAEARAQFRRLEGLGQVIDRAELETPQLVRRAVPGGQHNDGDGLGLGRLLELPQQLKPVHARQSQVEQDQVEMLLPRPVCSAGGGVSGTGERDVVIVQQAGQELRHIADHLRPTRPGTRANS